jgi:hypothetical protein
MIDFIGANNGKIEMTLLVEKVVTAESSEEVADAISTYGMAEDCWMSSSMDFASEHGFASDSEAKEIFNLGVKISKERGKNYG